MTETVRKKWEALGISSPRAKFVLSAMHIIQDMSEITVMRKTESLVSLLGQMLEERPRDEDLPLRAAMKNIRDAFAIKKRESWPERSQPQSPLEGHRPGQKKKIRPARH